MTIAEIPGLGRFELEWSTTSHPTPDPGGDPWLIELDNVYWLCNHVYIELGFVGVEVNKHALWHKMPDGRTLYETLEFWVYENEEYDPNDYDYSDW